MTGGNPEQNSILEIYALKYRNHTVTDHYHQLVNPQRRIPPMLRRITGIHPHMVATAPPIDQVMPGFMDFIEGSSVLVAHNVACDLKFIHHYSQAVLATTPQNFFLCTHLLAEKLFIDSHKKSLRGLCEHLGLPLSKAHRAKNDTMMTLALFEQIVSALLGAGIRTLEAALRFQGDYATVKRLGWRIPPAELAAAPNSPGIYWLYDHNRQLLLWGTAVSLARHVNQLPQSTQLSRAQYRKIMAATQLKTMTISHFLDACLYPLAHPDQFPKSLRQVSTYHQAKTLYLTVRQQPDSSALRIAITRASPGDKLRFGPVLSKTTAQHWLKRLAEQYNSELKRHELIIKLAPPATTALQRLLSSPQRPQRILREIRRLLQRQQKELGDDVTSLWGFIITPEHPPQNSVAAKSLSSSAPRLKIYPLCNSTLGNPITTDRPFQRWRESNEARRFIRRMKRKQPDSASLRHTEERLLLGLWTWRRCTSRSSSKSATAFQHLIFEPL